MTWTTEKPTKPGWYWWRQLPTDTEFQIVRVRVDDMGLQSDDGKSLIALNDKFYELVENMPGEWAALLEPPK